MAGGDERENGRQRAPDRFAPYAPRVLLRLPADTPQQAREGTLASVDLSGFTALTERLVAGGRDGVEEINAIVSTIFTALIDIVMTERGDVLSFGGDAILVWFDAADDAADDPDPAVAVDHGGAVRAHPLRAARCVAALQRSIRRIGTVAASCGTTRLRMSIGVHSGSLQFALVGDREQQLLTLGPVATRVVELEAAADAGQVLLSATTAASLPDRWVDRDAEGRRMLRIGKVPAPVPAAVMPAAIARVSADVPGQRSAEALLPLPARAEIGHLAGEHRLVTVAFVKVEIADQRVADEPDRVWHQLDAFARLLSRRCAEFDVMWLATDIAPAAVKFIIVGGAPVTHEDDEERVLRVCRALIDEAGEAGEAGGPGVHIGVTNGPVYFGDLGHPQRRALTTMGDTMNLAARLMGRAGSGQIVATTAVVDRTFVAWSVEQLAPFAVKGKRLPIHACVVGAPAQRREATDHHDVIGRDRELAVLAQALTAAAAGTGATIDIVAAAGAGKSALVAAALATADGPLVVSAVGNPYLAAASYRAIAQQLRQLFAVHVPADLRALVRRVVPDRAPLLPLLADAFGWALPDTTASRRIAPEFRQERTAALVGELAGESLLSGVLWVDDVQWFDDASLGVLQSLSRQGRAGGLLLIVTRRPEGAVPLLHGAITLSVRPLTAADSAAVVARRATRPLHPHVIAAIVERAGGHPFFLQALTVAASAATSDDAAASAAALPESVERAAAAVLDRLPADARAIVRLLAVGGKSVALAELAAAADDATLKDRRRWRQCADVVEVRDGVASFRHDLYRDAAYVGLSVAKRRALHGRFADAMTAAAATDEAWRAAAPALAVHLLQARRVDEAWRAGVVAARSAAAAGSWRDADLWWSRSLGIVPQLAARPHDLPEVLCEAALACERLGRLAEAESLLRRALRLAPSVGTSVDLARVRQRQGNLAGAASTVRRARRLVASPAESAEAGLRLASILSQMGHSRRATAIELELLDDGDLSRLQRGRAALQAQLSLMAAGDPRESEFGDMAIELLTGVECGASLGDALNNQSLAHWYSGRLIEGGRRAAEAMAAYDAVGDAMGVAVAANNLAGIWLDQGRLMECEPLLLRCLRTFEAANDRFSSACIRAAMGTLALRNGRLAEAAALLAGARADFVEIGADDLVLDADLRHCEVLLWRHHAAAARTLADDCLERSHRWSAGGLNIRWARRLRAWALSQLGEATAARAEAEVLLADARAAGVPAEVALGLATLEALDKVESITTPRRLVRERVALMRRIGLVWVPALPVASPTAPSDTDSPASAAPPARAAAHLGVSTAGAGASTPLSTRGR